MRVPIAELQRQAFPLLSEDQIALLRPFGEVQRTRAGEVLFEVGDGGYPLVVVLSGCTEIVDRSEGVDRHITSGGPGDFHGELGLLTGQTVFAACVVREPGEVLIIGSEPCTDWLQGSLSLDGHGFVMTGAAADGASTAATPYLTSLPGIFIGSCGNANCPCLGVSGR